MPSRSLFRFQHGDKVDKLLSLNKGWAKKLNEANPGLFAANAKGQNPPIFWISCADSRYGDYNTDLLPGEILAHRNVANMVPNCDPSSQSAIQLAMQVVGCEHIVVCGHTSCKGIQTALTNERVGGSLEAWLRNVRDVRAKYARLLDSIEDTAEKEEKFAELNVVEQVYNVRTNDIVREHMKKRGVQVHGMMCDVGTGLLRLLDIPEDPGIKCYAVDYNGH